MTSKMSSSKERDPQKAERLVQGQRSDPPQPSCVSMKSEWSVGKLINFREDTSLSSAEFSLIRRNIPDSPEPSHVSMRSDRSMSPPLFIRQKDRCTDLRLIPKQRLMGRWDWSPNTEENYNPPVVLFLYKKMHIFPPLLLFLALKVPSYSPCATYNVVFANRNQKEIRKNMTSLFKELEHKVISLVKNELKRFVELMSLDYPACSEREVEDEEDQSVREGALKITLHVLRNMNQTDLANTLQTRVQGAVVTFAL
ncbi:hypothetical protein AOLI_G00189160 [Acnodon oligacanthus]